ncbi:TRAP transporter substrate-binding protein [Aquibaculum sediminis]|uniref:TRAP transporter substrate-binding protein n=1 Tax=Aquibaculum sediminis TaxID=3231907 RepID=UPI003454671C
MRHLTKTAALIGAIGMLATPALAIEAKLGHLAPPEDPRHESLELFAERVAEGTDGEISVSIYPNSTLGGERELVEQAQAGITELALVGSIVANFYPAWSIIDMPFLWNDEEHLSAFIESDRAQGWAAEMAEELGFEMLGFFQRNPRILTTRNQPVNSIEDLSGLKVRVPDIQVYTDTWRAYNVEPAPMPAADFYMALRLGMIDGMENPVEVMYHWKIHEVADYLSLTNHMRSGFFFVASKNFMDSLTDEQRAVVQEAAKEAQDYLAQKNAEGAAELLDKLRAEGMEIIENPDISGFVEASRGVHEQYMDVFGRDAYDEAVALGSR